MSEPSIIIEVRNNLLPAPYAYDLDIKLQQKDDGIGLNFSMFYIGRDELSEEEIIDEGFSLNDDIQWQGKIGQEWWTTLTHTIKNTKSVKAQKENPSFIKIECVDIPELNFNGAPHDYQAWEYLINELIQAAFEASGKELPLEIQMLKNELGKKSTIKINASFANRTAHIAINSSKVIQNQLDWNTLRGYLKIIYQPDYIPEKAVLKPSNKEGIYVSIFNETWYELGKGIIEPSKKSKSLSRIEKLVDDILQSK